jgi:hypothetical protein
MVRRHMTRAAPSYVPVRQSSLPRRRAWPEHNTRRLAAGTGQKELAEYRLSVAWTLSMANRGGAVSVLAAGSDEATMLTIIQMYELLSQSRRAVAVFQRHRNAVCNNSASLQSMIDVTCFKRNSAVAAMRNKLAVAKL